MNPGGYYQLSSHLHVCETSFFLYLNPCEMCQRGDKKGVCVNVHTPVHTCLHFPLSF